LLETSVLLHDNSAIQGLYDLCDCFNKAMAYLEISPEEWKQMISLGCDGTSVNIESGGLKGHLERDFP